MRRTLALSLIGTLLWVMVLTPPMSQAQAPETPNWTRAVVWSPDGTQVAVATQRGSIQLIDQSEQVIRTLQAENGVPVLALAWSPNSQFLASGGSDNLVTVWDVITGDVVKDYPSQASVNGLSWHPNGSYLTFASANAPLKNAVVWNTVTGETIFATPASEAFSVAWSPDGSLLAISKFGEIQIWDLFLSPDQPVKTIKTQPHNILFLAWKSDSTRLASAQTNTPDQSVANVWDSSTGQLVLSYTEHADAIRTVAWSPDGNYLASASIDGTVRIWDSVNGQTLETFQGNGGILAVDWSPDSTHLAYGIEGGVLEIVPAPASNSCSPTAPSDPPTYTVTAGDTAGLVAAIGAANATPDPDIIALEEGTYPLSASNNTLYGKNGLPVINTPITIYGNCATIARNPAAQPFRLFYVTAAGNLTLYDLTLTGGDGGTSNGGAIYSQGAVTATNTTIANSTAPGGGGIRNSSGTLTLIDSRLENNSAPGTGSAGGGLYTNGPATLTNTTLTGNSAYYGGAIYTASGGTLTLSGSTVESNSAYSGGGAFINGGSATIQANSRFAANTVNNHGGAIYNNGTTLTISGSTFENNTAAGGGGAIRNAGPLTLTDSQITGNSAVGNGGGLFLLGGTTTLTNVTLEANHTGQNGGGIFTSVATTLTGSTVSNNSAANNGGGLFISGGSLSLTASQVTGNTSGNGGGGIFSTGAPVLLSGSLVSGNSAVSGGGGIGCEGRLTITDSQILNNHAGDEGGGVYNDNRYSPGISNTCIAGNTAPQAGGVYSVTSSFPARNTWWGAADSPSGSGPGSGDAINSRVLYSPYLTTDCPH